MTPERLEEIREWVALDLIAHNAAQRQKMTRELLAETDRLRALVEWRPIETAPKLGRHIQGWDGQTICRTWYDPVENCWFAVQANRAPYEWHPTHWLPLPNPPEVME